MDFPKSVRFAEFLRRLSAAPPAASFDGAYALVRDTLNQVEDELTTIPYAPENWQTDGRLYPPEMDNIRDVPGNDRVKRFRSLAHNTFIAENGAIEIQEVRGAAAIFSKASADGLGVWAEKEDTA